jgi:lipopolysaccharide/colanic/teichoic acid biosynthesis glycosyltransferase
MQVISLSKTLTTNGSIEDSQFYFYENAHRSVNSKAKRSIDVIGAVVGLGITSVLFVPIAIAMQLDSPGPILYSQTRCGLNGKKFRIWKFRSMRVGADREKHLVENQAQGFIFKNKNDPRVTKIGKFLRCSSLDEFPQFWNVLTGEMSLVGTRPPTPDEVALYKENHLRRLEVKPGITGEWQVKGRSGVKNFEEIVNLDLDYQRKWSVIYDISLILRTVTTVLSRKGAY